LTSVEPFFFLPLPTAQAVQPRLPTITYKIKPMKNLILIIALTLFSFNILAQQATQKKPDAELLQFFAGKWTGDGKFFNDKPIAADLDFSVALDGSWLTHTHTDKAPNNYKATSWWGVDPISGEFVAYIFDNFGGQRKFTSNGWQNGKLILTTQQLNAKGETSWQHFVYEKLSEASFKMTYEVSKDGTTWRMVDYLVFKRAAKV